MFGLRYRYQMEEMDSKTIYLNDSFKIKKPPYVAMSLS